MDDQVQDFTITLAMAHLRGAELERSKIVANIRSRILDLRACTKQDNCNELADLIESYIPEWVGEE